MSEVFLSKSDDPEMEAAGRQARQTFRFFWREMTWERQRIIPALGMAAVKIRFEDPPEARENADGPSVENMWVSDVEYDGREIRGTLLNQPNWLTSVSEGDAVVAAPNRIVDWMYTLGERAYGGFTVQLLRSRMSPGERSQHDNAWGLDFGDPTNVLVVPPDYLGHEEQSSGGFLGLFKKNSPPPPQSWGEVAATEHPMAVNCAEMFRTEMAANPETVMAADEEGVTPLHRFALGGSELICDILLDSGADPSVKTAAGRTPAQLAKAIGWKKLSEKLVAKS